MSVSAQSKNYSRLLSALFVLAIGSVASSTVGWSLAEPDWEKTGTDEGIELFRKEIPGSPVIAFMGQTTIDAPIGKVVSVLLDTKRATEWVGRLEELKILKEGKVGEPTIEYTHIGTPFILKDRDFVVEVSNSVDPVSKTFVREFHSVEFEGAPKTSYVRGEMLTSSFTLRVVDEDHTFVIAEIHTDPKGSVAKWIVNLFQKKWPVETLTGMKKQVAKADIEENLVYKKMIFGADAQSESVSKESKE